MRVYCFCYSCKSVLCWLLQHSTANRKDDIRVCSDADSLETISSASACNGSEPEWWKWRPTVMCLQELCCQILMRISERCLINADERQLHWDPHKSFECASTCEHRVTESVHAQSPRARRLVQALVYIRRTLFKHETLLQRLVCNGCFGEI